MDLTTALASLAHETKFPTDREIARRVDALAGAFPSRVRAETIGASREGRPLHSLTVGSGERHAVVIGMPHPNEPTGALGALNLAELLARDDELRGGLGLTWHIVPCADPDGGVLNRTWFAGPYSRQAYSGGVYRPPITEDVEWTFRREGLREPGLPTIPESRAIMSLLDAVRPELLVSMHNSEAGGLFAYVTDDLPSIVDGFIQTSILTDLPVDHGLAESAVETLAPGIFFEKPQLDGGAQLSSTDYAAQYGTFGVVVEPPLWVVPVAADRTPTMLTAGDLYAQVERDRAQVRGRYHGWLHRLGSCDFGGSALWRAVHAGTEHLDHPWEPTVAEDRLLTAAEASTVRRMFDLERLRLVGQLVRAIRDSPHTASTTAWDVQLDAASTMRRWAAEAINGPFCGLDASVAAHVGVALTCAVAVNGRG